MNKLYTCVAAALLSISAAFASTEPDTTILQDTYVTVVQTQNSQSPLTFEGSRIPRQGDDRLSVNIHESLGGSWDAVMRGFMFGFVNAPASQAGMDVEMGKSFEWSVLQLVGVRYSTPTRNTSISFGIGIDWRNYKMSTASARFVSDGYGHVATGPYPEGVNARFSRLKVFSLNFPILFEQKLPFRVPGKAKFSITGGVVLNYSPHASMLTEWTDTEGNRVEESCNSIGQRQFSVDLIGILRFCKFAGLYVKYSPQTVLHGSNNLSFHTFSTGLICFY